MCVCVCVTKVCACECGCMYVCVFACVKERERAVGERISKQALGLKERTRYEGWRGQGGVGGGRC